jgi:hypothetical protein
MPMTPSLLPSSLVTKMVDELVKQASNTRSAAKQGKYIEEMLKRDRMTQLKLQIKREESML